jgi:predicted nucleic acid-binding protein
MMGVTRDPKIRQPLAPAIAGRLVNELLDIAVVVKNLPVVTVSIDPYDDYLLSIAAPGSAYFLVTGDKHDLLGLKLYKGTKIIAVRDFLILHRRLP